ncbi:DinB family protein [Paenibacillus sp. PR3]|uniref:DinB family protein n=1 Tax=Paenibacillus terricola TaxID=2763503 RepID=A0ABR8MV91_9BACL|nr:DinB family protein [Paenibacillus terricola]MBD3919495.1 DinB family protein [Paenibacillus terricola]
MNSKDQLIEEFARFIPFVEGLRQLDEETWAMPIARGKWTTRDVIAHMMLWDKYFLEGAIAKVAVRQPLTVRHMDFDEFNRNAVEYAKTKERAEIIDLAVRYRKEIIEHIRQLSDEEWIEVRQDGDGHPFAIDHYVPDFIAHDEHHIKQLQAFLNH